MAIALGLVDQTQKNASFRNVSDIAALFVMLLPWVYFWLLTALNKGQTLGKMITGIRVVSAEGEAPGLGQTALRELVGKGLTELAFGLGFLWILWDKQRQGWHDKIAHTYVIKLGR